MTKKKLLVMVCGRYYPVMSPTAMCAEKYASLFADEYDIEVISESQNGKDETIDSENGFRIHTLSCLRTKLEQNSKGIIRKFLHHIGSAMLFIDFLGNQRWYRKAVSKKLEHIHRSKPIDVVFTISSPLAAHCGSVDFKTRHSEVLLCSYTVDPYSTPDRIKPVWRSRSQMLSFERKVLKRMDYVLLSEELYNTRPELYEGIANCRALPYMMPVFSNSKPTQDLFDSDKVNCLYAGSFYSGIRNPEFLLNVFSYMPHNVILHLYSKGCENIVSRYRAVPNIILHDTVTLSELQAVYNSADILIGVGNAVRDFLPSKTFEYISQLKPIVYFNHADIENEVLSDYPIALQLSDEEDLVKASSKLRDFCTACASRAFIEKDAILNSYKKHTPPFIKEIIENAFSKKYNCE